jgi:hypothetical protein
VLLTTLALLAGCGSSDSDEPAPTPDRYLLTSSQIERLAEETDNPEAVEAVFEFWRSIQFQAYGRAYDMLAEQLQAELPYRRFQRKIAEVRYLFLARPEVYDLEGDDPVTVFIVAPQGEQLTDDDQVIGFSATREDGEWRIGSDPFNTFHEPDSEAGQAVP